MINVPIYLVVGSPAECIDYYQIEYKLTTSAGYTLAENQYTLPLYLYNLEDNATYDVRITPFCCNGQYGSPLVFVVSTTELTAPANFNLVQDGADVDGTWDAVSGATNYIAERASDSTFETDLSEVYSGSSNSFTDLAPPSQLWYYRVKAQMTSSPDSAWSTDSITVV